MEHRGEVIFIPKTSKIIKYYNQDYLVKEIYRRTNIPTRIVRKVLNELGEVTSDRFAKTNYYGEIAIKVFNGLKLTSKYVPADKFSSNLDSCKDNSGDMLRLKGYFTDQFRYGIKAKSKIEPY